MKKKEIKTFQSAQGRTTRSEPSRTTWGKVSGWYDKMVEGGDGYQSSLILPNLLRILDVKNGLPAGRQGLTIVDVACGQGFFSREFAKLGARVYGSDISAELIKLAEKNTPPSLRPKISYQVAPSDNLSFLKSESADVAVIVLALQNIEKVRETVSECFRVLKKGGRLIFILNHPAFRVPKESSWGWDPSAGSGQVPSAGSAGSPRGGSGQVGKGVQYRRIDQYLSESRTKIQMHPSAGSSRGGSGQVQDDYTISFHRPLQFYFKALAKSNFLVSRFEEWTSNRVSEKGPRSEAEDRARKEIPLFLCIEAIKK